MLKSIKLIISTSRHDTMYEGDIGGNEKRFIKMRIFNMWTKMFSNPKNVIVLSKKFSEKIKKKTMPKYADESSRIIHQDILLWKTLNSFLYCCFCFKLFWIRCNICLGFFVQILSQVRHFFLITIVLNMSKIRKLVFDN